MKKRDVSFLWREKTVVFWKIQDQVLCLEGKDLPKKKRERERSFVEKIFQETLKPVNVNQSSFFKDITVKVFFF